MKQAVILAGGKGTRLSRMFGEIPKPMVPFRGRPLLEITVEHLSQQGVRDIVLFTGFQSEKIESHFEDGSKWGTRIRIVKETSAKGTAGQLMESLAELDEKFLVVYGDTLFHVDLARFEEFHESSRAEISLFLHPNDHPYDSDLVEIGDDGRVLAFHKSPHAPGAFHRNLVNAALYIVNKSALGGIPARAPLDFAKDIFPRLLEDKRIFGYVSREYIKDMGTPDRFEKVQRDYASGKVARFGLGHALPAVFLDRDGTLSRATDYVRSTDELELLPNVASSIGKLNYSDHLSVLITNQPVLARGEVSEEGLRSIHNKLETELGREHAFLNGIYFCPHHPDRGFKGERPELKIECECRKPKTGMITRASSDLNIDLARSWFIGDTTTDVQTARHAGIPSILVRTGYGGRDRKFKVRPDFEVADMAEAVDLVLTDHAKILKTLDPVLSRLRDGQHIVLGGPARSGKSLVASTLKRAIGERATVVSLDSWLKPQAERGPTVEERYDLVGFSNFLENLESASELVLPYYDRHTRSIEADGFREPLNPGQCLIFEGTIALCVPVLLKLDSLRVYVEAPRSVRWARFQKEYRLRGWPESDIEKVFRARENEEIPFIQSTRSAADFVLTLAEKGN